MIFQKKLIVSRLLIVSLLFCCNQIISTQAEINDYTEVEATLNQIAALTPECTNLITTTITTEPEFDSYKSYRYAHPKPKKHITFMTYMAADNNLAFFARKNLDQQAQIGSNNLINIVTELDTRLSGNQKVTKLYYVQKNQLVILNNDDPSYQKMDSGDPETLIKFCRFAIKNFPADHYVLVLWNHGTGCIDIGQYSAFNSSKLFRYNTDLNMLELDRSMPFLEFITQSLPDPRGLCFDDTTGHYITNQGLEYALNTICNECLNGKKLDIIGFDACLMSMLEIGNIIKDYAHYMVGSQEVELALGWRYDLVLEPATQHRMNMHTFAQHIVEAYREMYQKITKDYTQSAVALEKLQQLEDNVSHVASLFLDALQNEKSNTIQDALKASRHKLFCTHFVEQSFIDLWHFYSNILNNTHKFQFKNSAIGATIKSEINKTLQQGISIMQQLIIANVVGIGLPKAKGISIYFPEHRIHNSYPHTKFAQTNTWSTFIRKYVQL